jgi:UDPglucose--hexose-1-phosphate uridylyltransferase
MSDTDSGGSQLRRDPLSGRQLIVAPGRGRRPNAGHDDSDARRSEGCPFCPGNEDQTPPASLEFPEREGVHGWYVRVVPNRFPIVSEEHASLPGAKARFVPSDALGFHEVVVETPEHDLEMAQRAPDQLYLTLFAYRSRLQSLFSQGQIRYVTLFKNKGFAAGNSLVHPHSQIAGLAFVPEAIVAAVRRWQRYRRVNGGCLLCDLIERERRDVVRLVQDEAGFVALSSFAGWGAGELLLAPVQHATSFAASDDELLRRMGVVLSWLLRSLRDSQNDPDYNLVLETWPKRAQRDPALHWYLRIIPRGSVLGGFELATGIIVDTHLPEDVAATLRSR